MNTTYSGHLDKMAVEHGNPVQYALVLDEQRVALNQHLGKVLRLHYRGEIHCTHCGRRSSKSFNQGYCYPCFKALARCDSCIVSPEKCHYTQGTCREPEWGEQYCMTDHVVYLANSSAIKVGITRVSQIPTRWIDQGAAQALPIARVKSRYQSGLVEDIFRQHVADKTNWRAMLKGPPEEVDLPGVRDELFTRCAARLDEIEQHFGLAAVQKLDDHKPVDIRYPVLEYPRNVASLNLDKQPLVEGTLLGIKGQYLILDTGVINLRKYTAYHLEVTL